MSRRAWVPLLNHWWTYGGDERAADRSLQALLLDYEMAREDERVLVNVQGVLLSIAVTLLVALVAVLSSACPIQAVLTTPTADCTPVAPVVLVATPLVPFSLFSYLVLLGAIATVRSYYMRALEAELRRTAPVELTALPGVRASSLIELSTAVNSLRRGRIGHRILVGLVLASNVVLFGGYAAFVLVAVPPRYALPAAAVYAAVVVVVLREAAAASYGGRALMAAVVRSHVDGPAAAGALRLSPVGPPQRTMVGYLLLPRPQDAIKWLFTPVLFGLGTLAAGGISGSTLLRAVVVWVTFELLIYQARYQWNDVRGFYADQAHAAAGDRRRLPGPVTAARSRFIVSGVVALLRLGAATAVCWWLRDLGVVAPLAWASIAVVIFAVAYEALRAAEVRPSLTRAAERTVVTALWVVVGGGYVVRGVLGLALATDLGDRPGLAALLVVALGAFGTTFVTATWTLEATAFAQLRLSAIAVVEGQVAGAATWPPTEPGRQHVMALTRWLPERVLRRDLERLPGRHLGSSLVAWRPLRDRRPLGAPHNAAAIVAGAAAGAAGAVLSGAGPGAVALASGVAVLTTVLVALTSSYRGRWAVAILGAVALVVLRAVSAPAIDDVFPADSWAVIRLLGAALIPWLLITATYIAFCNCSWSELKDPLAGVRRTTAQVGVAVGRAVVGPDAWARLHR